MVHLSIVRSWVVLRVVAGSVATINILCSNHRNIGFLPRRSNLGPSDLEKPQYNMLEGTHISHHLYVHVLLMKQVWRWVLQNPNCAAAPSVRHAHRAFHICLARIPLTKAVAREIYFGMSTDQTMWSNQKNWDIEPQYETMVRSNRFLILITVIPEIFSHHGTFW